MSNFTQTKLLFHWLITGEKCNPSDISYLMCSLTSPRYTHSKPVNRNHLQAFATICSILRGFNREKRQNVIGYYQLTLTLGQVTRAIGQDCDLM